MRQTVVKRKRSSIATNVGAAGCFRSEHLSSPRDRRAPTSVLMACCICADGLGEKRRQALSVPVDSLPEPVIAFIHRGLRRSKGRWIGNEQSRSVDLTQRRRHGCPSFMRCLLVINATAVPGPACESANVRGKGGQHGKAGHHDESQRSQRADRRFRPSDHDHELGGVDC